MNKEDIVLRRLGENDAVARFDCGDDDLNDFIFGDALLYYKVRLATTYVLEDKYTKDTVGFFSLAQSIITVDGVVSIISAEDIYSSIDSLFSE